MKLVQRVVGIMLMLSMIVFARPQTTSAQEALETKCFDVYGINDCLEGDFLNYWNTNGGLPVFGYPITGVADELNNDTNMMYPTQWVERNRFEWHAENAGTPYQVLLGLLGKERLAQVGRDWANEPREAGPKDGCLWFEQTGHNVCNQSGNLGFKTYWETHGLKIAGLDSYAQSLQLFGLPLTEPAMETNAAGDTVMTQWFERGRFEWHPGNEDAYKVLLGLLGREVHENGQTQPQPQPQPQPEPTDPCADVPDPVSARVRPAKCGVEGTVFSMDFYGFTANEEVGLWLTAPNGAVVGTRQTLNIGPNGSVSGLPFDTNGGDAGIWQWTMEGISSKHQSIVYIKITPNTNTGPARCTGNIPEAVNGLIEPTCVDGYQVVGVIGYGFEPGEKIGYYATTPNQSVIDLQPQDSGPLMADEDGTFLILFTIDGSKLDAGVYAITFEGINSGHKTIVYFEGQ